MTVTLLLAASGRFQHSAGVNCDLFCGGYRTVGLRNGKEFARKRPKKNIELRKFEEKNN